MKRRVLKEVTRKNGFKFYKFNPPGQNIKIPEGSQVRVAKIGPEPASGMSDVRPWGVIVVSSTKYGKLLFGDR